MRLVDNIFNSMLGQKSSPAISAAVQDLDNTAENYNPEVMAWLNSTSWYKGNPNYITFEEAAAVDSEQFSDGLKSAIVTFDEARFFTSVTDLTPKAFYNCNLLKRITIPDSITSIGSYAFYNCKSLALTSLPNGLTTIGVEAFQNCITLKDTLHEIPSSVTEFRGGAFRYVEFPRLKFLGLTPPTFGTQSLYNPKGIDCQVPSASLAEYQQAMKVLTDTGLITISTY